MGFTRSCKLGVGLAYLDLANCWQIELWEEAVETMKAQECDANYPLEVEDATTALDYQGEGLTSIACKSRIDK